MRFDIFMLLLLLAAALYFASRGMWVEFGYAAVLWAIAALISLIVSLSGDKNDRNRK
jgi:hypothetical protein